MGNAKFEIFVSGIEDKVDVMLNDGRWWGVYYNPEEKYKWTEDVCSQCGQTKGGYARNISVQVKEIVDSDRMVSVKRCPSNLKDAIAEFLMDYDEFVCLECECEDEK